MAESLSPAARALLALEAIQTSPGISGERLAARLGVSDRAARRYVGILREAGIPIRSESGPYGGYRLGRGARVPPLTFSTAEALGLVMAVLQGWHGSVDAEHPAGTALNKILRVLPAAAAEPAEALRRIKAQNPGDAAAIPDSDVTAAVALACENHTGLELGYRGSTLVVDPWAVVVRHGRWYLLCWAHGVDARRVLRLDRIEALTAIDRTFAPPADLDPIREVEDHLADGWGIEVEVRVAAPLATIGPCVPRALGRLTEAGPDDCVLTGSTSDPLWYAQQLAAIPAGFTVVEPPELKQAVRSLAERLARAAAD